MPEERNETENRPMTLEEERAMYAQMDSQRGNTVDNQDYSPPTPEEEGRTVKGVAPSDHTPHSHRSVSEPEQPSFTDADIDRLLDESRSNINNVRVDAMETALPDGLEARLQQLEERHPEVGSNDPEAQRNAAPDYMETLAKNDLSSISTSEIDSALEGMKPHAPDISSAEIQDAMLVSDTLERGAGKSQEVRGRT